MWNYTIYHTSEPHAFGCRVSCAERACRFSARVVHTMECVCVCACIINKRFCGFCAVLSARQRLGRTLLGNRHNANKKRVNRRHNRACVCVRWRCVCGRAHSVHEHLSLRWLYTAQGELCPIAPRPVSCTLTFYRDSAFRDCHSGLESWTCFIIECDLNSNEY